MTFTIDPQSFTGGERLLWSFGVSSPDEIDLDAIAFDCGLTVRRRPLEGADARLVAFENRGVITVNSLQSPKRQRFSIGHELSHWLYDRSTNGDGMLACSKDDVSPRNQAARGKEADANRFSADLVLPPYLVAPRIQSRQTNIELAIEFGQ
jgi:Zn-dependent peptidase ImmA (M78 family)